MEERLLGLSEICSATGMDKSALNRYLLAPNEKNRALFGGERTHPKYPVHSLPAFRTLKRLHDEKQVTPQTLLSLWTMVQNSGAESEVRPNVPAVIDPLRDRALAARIEAEEIAPVYIELIAQAIVRHAAGFADALRLSGVVEDRLLTRQQAAEVLACSPLAVGRYVKPVRRNVWRMSDLQRYIRELGK